MTDKKLGVLAFPKSSRNPYIPLLYQAVEQHIVDVAPGNSKEVLVGEYDLVHYHWPESFLNYRHQWHQRWRGFLKVLWVMFVSKARGKKLIWTMHNVEAHEEKGRFLPGLFRRILFHRVDGLIALSNASYQMMMARYPKLRRKPFLLSWIGDYRKIYPDLPAKADAKHQKGMGKEEIILGFFGAIRPYKNISQLIKVFGQLDNPQARLVIVGVCEDPYLQKELDVLVKDDARVQLRTSFLPETEVPWVVRSIDLMVLPFRSVLNSSSVLLSLSLDVPVLVPAMGSLVEIAEVVGSEWVRTYEDELTVKILEDAITWASSQRSERAPLDAYAWDECGKTTARFYRSIVNGGTQDNRVQS